MHKSYAFSTFAQRDFQAEIANKSCRQMQKKRIVENFASSTAMGPTMVPLELFLNNFPEGFVPAKGCAVISFMFGRRGFQTARLDFSKNTKKQQNRPYSYRSPFLQNTPGEYNITWNGFNTKPYPHVICTLNIRVARFSPRNV